MMKISILNIFKQFMPTKILSFPLTLMGSMMAMSWIFLKKKSHWMKKRSKSMKNLKKILFKEFLQKKTKTWKTNLFTLFLLCLSFNMMSLIPYTFSQTSHLSMTFSMSLPMWLLIQTTGIKKKTKKKMSHLLPKKTPMVLMPFMIIMETISLFMQPLTLGFRLGANLLAGHLLIFLCSCTMWEITKTKPLGFLTISLMFLLLMLEMAVACMQATVFLILSKSYLKEKLNN